MPKQNKNQIKFFEISAKDFYNINETFNSSVNDIDLKIKKGEYDFKSEVSNINLKTELWY